MESAIFNCRRFIGFLNTGWDDGLICLSVKNEGVTDLPTFGVVKSPRFSELLKDAGREFDTK